jgi:hypothetical protein
MVFEITDGVVGDSGRTDIHGALNRMLVDTRQVLPGTGLESLRLAYIDAEEFQTLTLPSAIKSKVNAIRPTAATPKNIQTMKIVCSIDSLRNLEKQRFKI